MLNKRIISALFAAVFIMLGTLPVYAVPSGPDENEVDPFEEEAAYSDTSASEMTSAPDISEPASDTEPATEPRQDSYSTDYEASTTEEYSYEQSYAQYTDEESYYYYEYSEDEEEGNSDEDYTPDQNEDFFEMSQESTEESSRITITDPFARLKAMNYILPSDDPNYVARQKKESSNAAAGAIRPNSGLLDSPPIPTDELVSKIDYTDEDDSALLTGIIFWSIIGIFITVLLIFFVNLKTGNNDAYGRKKYRSSYRPSKKHHGKYKISGR